MKPVKLCLTLYIDNKGCLVNNQKKIIQMDFMAYTKIMFKHVTPSHSISFIFMRIFRIWDISTTAKHQRQNASPLAYFSIAHDKYKWDMWFH